MTIYPNFYLDSILNVTPEFCKQNNIKGLILDIDNTLIDIEKKMIDGAKEWHNSIIDAGIKTIIVSNTNKLEKVSKVASDLETDFIYFAKKPSKKGFIEAKGKLRVN